MYMYKLLTRITPLLTLLLCLQGSTSGICATPEVTTQLADHYLQSFIEPIEKQAPPLLKPKKTKKAKASFTDVTTVNLTPRSERTIVFNEIFAKSNYYGAQYKNNVLNRYVWKDLHLFYGTTTAPTHHFFSRINKTITVLGEIALASLISAPIKDLQILTKRQQLLRFFFQEAEVSNNLKNELQAYKASEKAILSLWSETDPLYTKEYNEHLTSLFYYKNPALNKRANRLQWNKIFFRDIWDIYATCLSIPLSGILITESVIAFSKQDKFKEITKEQNVRKKTYEEVFPLFLPIWNFYHINNKNKGISSKTPLYIFAAIDSLAFIWRNYEAYSRYKTYSSCLQNLALRMADLQTFLAIAKKINTLVQNNPYLEELYSQQLTAIRGLLARSNEQSEVGELLRYLEKLPLRSWSYIRHNAGKLLASYKLFLEHKSIFHDAMYTFGELDAFLSVATLIKETNDIGAPCSYTFTQFLSSKNYTKPHLELTEMWNPMLEPTKAIGNDVIMHAHKGVRNMILTGPNAGGKSTFLTGTAQAILLSQTFGIAPAKSCKMTPFSKINTYIDITDDIAAGKSLFLAEVSRFQDHLDLLKQSKEEEFSFSIFDEPFSGTNPIEGAAAEYAVLNSISKYTNALLIVATHYPIVMLLEQNEPTKGFKNYKVFINYKPNGTDIEYTYKVIPGMSNQTIAIDILANQGYAPEILKQAKDIINHPEKYKKSFKNHPEKHKKNVKK